MSKKLSPAMQELLDAIPDGAEIAVWGGPGASAHCAGLSIRINTAWALIDRGFLVEAPRQVKDSLSMTRYVKRKALDSTGGKNV